MSRPHACVPTVEAVVERARAALLRRARGARRSSRRRRGAQPCGRRRRAATGSGSTSATLARRLDARSARARRRRRARASRRCASPRCAASAARATAARVAALPGIRYVEPRSQRASDAEPALVRRRPRPGGALRVAVRRDARGPRPDSVLRAAACVTIAVVDTGADLGAPDLAAKAPRHVQRHARHARRPRHERPRDVRRLARRRLGDERRRASRASAATRSCSSSRPARRRHLHRRGRGGGDRLRRRPRRAHHQPQPRRRRTTSTTERARSTTRSSHGVLLVAAAGNERRSAAIRSSIRRRSCSRSARTARGGIGLVRRRVGRRTARGRRFSNTGSLALARRARRRRLRRRRVDLVAARRTRGALPGSAAGLYGFASGTSFAAPQVAGAAALVWAANPSLTAQQVARILKETASGDGAWTPDLGFGVIDVAPAVATAAQRRRSRRLLARQRANGVHARLERAPRAARSALELGRGRSPRGRDADDRHRRLGTAHAGHAYRFTVRRLDATAGRGRDLAAARLTVARARRQTRPRTSR